MADWVRQRHLPKASLPTISIAVLLALAIVTHRQIGYWSDDLTLWSHAQQVTKDNWVAEDMVAGVLLNRGHREDAMRHYWAAIAIYPADWRSNFAIALYEQGRGNLPEAIQRYKQALVNMENPLQQSRAYQNMAIAYSDSGDLTQAMECHRKAEKLRGEQ